MSIEDAFLPIFADIYPDKDARPLLAHYTSIENVERILQSDELWFSNPLLMNDLEEMRFGFAEAKRHLVSNVHIQQALGTPERFKALIERYEAYDFEFDQNHGMDVYVLCFSEHSDSDDDGLLSMWRAYGAEGNGAAMVFDSSKVMSKSESPITFGPVRYGDDTERSALLNGIFLQVAAIITTLTIGDADIFKLAWQIHWRIKYFALFTKHAGFREEHEWRLVYMKQRDPKNELKDAVGYNISRHGIEPKLRFSLKDRYEFTEPDLSLEKLVRKIILGPTTATPLAKKAFLRMLELTGKTELMGRVVGSTIPYRRR